MRLVTAWRFCMDYHNLNAPTEKSHFPISFMDQMLNHLDKRLVLFSREIFGLQSNLYIAGRSREDYFNLPLWDIFFQKDVIWVV